MVTVDPKAIRFLQESAAPKEPQTESATEEGDEATLQDPDTTSSSEGSKRSARVKSDLTPFHPPPYSAPFMFIPAYLEVSFPSCSAIYLRDPTARPGYSEVPTPFDADGEIVRLAWEWYSRTRPRVRSKSQLARMPENRH